MSPFCQSIAKAEPVSPWEAGGGCCPNAGRRQTKGGGEEPGGSGLCEAAALAHRTIPVTRVPLGHGSSGPIGSISAVAISQPWMLAPSSLWPSSPPEAESRGPVPVQAAEVTIYYSPQLFLSLRFLAMVVQEPVAVRRSHCARSSTRPQVADCGRLCLRWAQFSHTLRMLLWRWWKGAGRKREEKTDEPSSASQARVHTNTSVTPSLPQPTPRA